MDKQYINKLRQDIIISLKRAEANIMNDQPVDLTLVAEHVQVFQNYLTKHMPSNPSDALKSLVHDVFLDIQRLSDQLTEEIHLSKHRLAETNQSQKIVRGYSYGGK